MQEYARLNIDGSTVLESRMFEERPPDIPHKNCRWLPVEITREKYDASTHVESPPTIHVLDDKVQVIYSVREKTLDDKTREQIGSMDIRLLTVLLDQENRLRKLEGLVFPIQMHEFIKRV
jgi:hypothetical protein